RDAALHADAPEVGTKSFPFAHGSDCGNRKNPSKRRGYRTSEEPGFQRTDEAPLHGSASHFSTAAYGFVSVEFAFRRGLFRSDTSADNVGARVVFTFHLRAGQPAQHG